MHTIDSSLLAPVSESSTRLENVFVLIQSARELERFYQHPRVRLNMVTEMLRHMAEFRFQVLGQMAHHCFITAIQTHPFFFLRPIRLEFSLSPCPRGFSWINVNKISQGLIYLDALAIERLTHSFSMAETVSFLETTLIHEWVHLLQFSIVEDQQTLMNERLKPKWSRRWYEQEAIYVAERVYQSRFYRKAYHRPNADGLIRQIAYRPDTPTPFLFNEVLTRFSH